MTLHKKQKLQTATVCFLLILLTAIVYSPVSNNGFINLDDDKYVVENPYISKGLTADTLKFAFTSTRASNWHPLTWISHAIDMQFFGLNPAAHHIVSLIIHIVASLMIFIVLEKMTLRKWPSAVVAFLFALHPLHVESVAWVSERKDVLSAFFFMLTLALYLWYTRRPAFLRYIAVLISLLLGLMAKSMLVTLPFVLLLLDYWPLQRLRVRTVVEKLPMILCSFIFCCITYTAQDKSGATALIDRLSFTSRIANALYAYVCYIGKFFYPKGLAVLYPHPGNSLAAWKPFVAITVLVAITAIFWFAFRSRKYLIVGWLWFLGMLVPVIGFVQVGYQAIADRYTYLPSIGFFILIVFALADLLSRSKYKTLSALTLSLLSIAIFSQMTFAQTKRWQGNLTLYKHTLENTEGNYNIHFNLGCAYRDQGQIEMAKKQFELTLQINPTYVSAHNNLGNILQTQRKYHQAIDHYNKALLTEPNNMDLRSNLGISQHSIGKTEDAIKLYYQSLRVSPDYPPMLGNLALFLAEKSDLRNTKEAVRYAQRACQLTGYAEPKAVFTLAVVQDADGQKKQAIQTALQARTLSVKKGNDRMVQTIDGWIKKVKK